ncbi:MBL fold metallo-hydrolase [Rhodoferax sp.]|uniref:MBL fold metallo-hydrolase n=1 Tax=Rhodoferax sp. TaxID=50421 RepID=UPI0025D81B3B|nr:MBL fold metallo-hydrolase [Rhodoferax sp.]
MRITWIIRTLLLALAAGVGTLAWWLTHPPGMEGVQTLRWPAEAGRATDITVRFLGVSTVVLDDGETALMTDGFFSRPDKLTVFLRKVAPDVPAITQGLQRAGSQPGASRLAAVIPLHSHYDHAMDAPEVARQTGALLLGSSSTLMVGQGWGLPPERMQLAQLRTPYRFGRFTVTLYPALHTPTGFTGGVIAQPLVPPVRATDYLEGQSYAMHIAHGNRTLLITGTAGFVPGALQGVKADVVLLGIGAMGPRSAEHKLRYWNETVHTVGARRVIPLHWDDFWIPSTLPMQPMPRPLDDFETSMDFLRQQGEADGVNIRLPAAWTPMDVFDGLPR